MITGAGFEKMSTYADKCGLYLDRTIESVYTAERGEVAFYAINIHRKRDGVCLDTFRDNSRARLKYLKATIDANKRYV